MEQEINKFIEEFNKSNYTDLNDLREKFNLFNIEDKYKILICAAKGELSNNDKQKPLKGEMLFYDYETDSKTDGLSQGCGIIEILNEKFDKIEEVPEILYNKLVIFEPHTRKNSSWQQLIKGAKIFHDSDGKPDTETIKKYLSNPKVTMGKTPSECRRNYRSIFNFSKITDITWMSRIIEARLQNLCQEHEGIEIDIKTNDGTRQEICNGKNVKTAKSINYLFTYLKEKDNCDGPENMLPMKEVVKMMLTDKNVEKELKSRNIHEYGQEIYNCISDMYESFKKEVKQEIDDNLLAGIFSNYVCSAINSISQNAKKELEAVVIFLGERRRKGTEQQDR